MKNTFKIIGIIALVAVIGFSFTACDDGNNEGTLRLQNIDTSGAYDQGRIIRVSIYKWGTSDSILSDGNTINPGHHRDFTLSDGEYRIELTSQVFRGGGYFMPKDRTSDKIIIAKGTTTSVYYDPSDGTFLY